jgi:DnaA family protein
VSAQIPLAFRFAPDQELAAFCRKPRAHRIARSRGSWSKRTPGCTCPGPPGSGKTHLLLAACAQARARGLDASYLPLAALSGRWARRSRARPAPRWVCLDGLEAIAGNASDEVALFHFP